MVIFLDKEWEELGTKESLRHIESDCAGIPIRILSGSYELKLSTGNVKGCEEKTSRIKDRAYWAYLTLTCR